MISFRTRTPGEGREGKGGEGTIIESLGWLYKCGDISISFSGCKTLCVYNSKALDLYLFGTRVLRLS